MPSFILIHPTVWPQYTNVTDRTDRQTQTPYAILSDSTGRTVLQAVAQKLDQVHFKIQLQEITLKSEKYDVHIL